MTNATENYEEEYQEYDEFDDEDERGLSGFAVLIMGLVMIGAFVSVVWIAYQQGIKTGRDGVGAGTPYVAADPEPIKIETAENETPAEDREVYDVFDGENEDQTTVLAEGPEEPVERTAEDTIGAIAAGADQLSGEAREETEGRLASLAQQDAEVLDNEPEAETAEPATEPTNTSTEPADNRPVVRVANQGGDALAGSHVVQVGAFGSNAEAETQWARLQSKLGDYLSGKSYNVEEAVVNGREYHRLRIGPFDTSDDAKSYCTGLKERGQDCLIKAL